MAATEPDPRFPFPPDPAKPSQPRGKREFYPEIDLGWGRWVMSDGRPAIFENWLDCDSQVFCRTVRYSTMEAEGWDERRHFEFLKKSGILRGKAHPSESAGINRIEDEAGQSWWSVTVSIYEEED